MAPKTPIGKILVEKQKIDQSQLGKALEQQRESGGKLASNLLSMGLAGERDLLLALGEQLGLPAVDLSKSIIPLCVLDVIPESVANQTHILPIAVDAERILLVMSNPEDKRALDELSFVTGKKIDAYVVLEARLNVVIREAYALHKRDPEAKFYKGEQAEFPDGMEDAKGYLAIVTQHLPEPDVMIVPDEELISVEVSTPSDVLKDMQLEASEEQPPPSQDSRPLVLVVDDEPDIVNMLKKALSADGFRVATAARGLEALQAVKSQNPNLILLDAMLPEIHGFEICKKIKSSKRFGHIPVIIISAIYKGWRYAQDAKETYGADDFFEKPFRIVPLLRRVRELLRPGTPSIETDANPNAAAEAYKLGVSHYREKRFDEAETALREACRLDPFNATIHFALANVLLAKNQIYEAIREYEQTIELKPDLFAPLRNLAILYQKKGFKNKAVEMWERALRASPEGEMRQQVREQLLKLL